MLARSSKTMTHLLEGVGGSLDIDASELNKYRIIPYGAVK
jgi:hypothetical protein